MARLVRAARPRTARQPLVGGGWGGGGCGGYGNEGSHTDTNSQLNGDHEAVCRESGSRVSGITVAGCDYDSSCEFLGVVYVVGGGEVVVGWGCAMGGS